MNEPRKEKAMRIRIKKKTLKNLVKTLITVASFLANVLTIIKALKS